jgi:integrase/recombinase XerC
MTEQTTPLFSAAYEGYLLAQQARHLSPAYRSLLTRTRDYWLRRHPDLPLEAYTPEHIRQWLVWLAGDEKDQERLASEKPMAGASVDVHYRNLKSFWLWCERDELLPFGSAQIRKVNRPKCTEKLPDALTADEVRVLLKAVKNNPEDPNAFRNYTILLFFCDSGVRLEELERLKLDDVNLAQGYAKVLGKGDKERLVKLGLELCRTISKYKLKYRKQSAGENALFTNDMGFRFEKAGVRIMVIRMLRAHVKRHLAKYGPHTLRHTYATSDLLENGDLHATSLQMGHRSTSTTERYLHLTAIMRGGKSPMDAILGK